MDVLDVARAHQLHLDPTSLSVIEMGMDFRVVMATDTAGRRWVLRIPRYLSVMKRAAPEAEILTVVARHLSVEVPDWQIHTFDLIAYPLLPGIPGVELTEAGEPIWNVDVSSPDYVESLAGVLLQLHSIPVEEVAATGITIHTPAQVREAWQVDLDTVSTHFTIDDELLHRWRAWVEDDSYWPRHSVLTHGEIYAGHTLVEDEVITGVIDWTTAQVGDPARDLMMQQLSGTPESFELLLETYVRGGGQIWPRIREHCVEMASASPVGFALYAREVENTALLQQTARMLNPSDHENLPTLPLNC